MNSRIALWLQEHFSFFKPEPFFKDLLRFLDGNMREGVCSTLSNDGSFGVIIENALGTLSYDREKGKAGKKIVVEEIEFIPRVRNEGGFSFTLVNSDISILRRNGQNPEYSPKISAREIAEISVFMNSLRLKTEKFLSARQ
ncbi:MAG: hypothetical protein G01um101417_40 [Parcubacteria group bacterium Gr01-1014_17]|nr:MAG: hypothetical protein G01um101417_40 [Parcubacteria group bacterium Gr01-1014_17]